MTENVSKADDDHYEKRRCSDYKIFLETNREGKKNETTIQTQN